jgi:hypothetical protein
MGSFGWSNTKNMTEDVNAVITRFWQSEFTWESSYAFRKFCVDNLRDGQGGERVDYLGSLEVWQKNTLENNLYATERTTKYKTGGPFRQFLLNDTKQGGSQSIVNNLKQEITKTVSSIGTEVQSLLKSVDLSSENQEKSHVQTLQSVIKEIVVAAYSELWEYSDKQVQDEIARLRKENLATLNQLKNDFAHYEKKVW